MGRPAPLQPPVKPSSATEFKKAVTSSIKLSTLSTGGKITQSPWMESASANLNACEITAFAKQKQFDFL